MAGTPTCIILQIHFSIFACYSGSLPRIKHCPLVGHDFCLSPSETDFLILKAQRRQKRKMQKDLFCKIIRVSFPDPRRMVLKRRVTVSDGLWLGPARCARRRWMQRLNFPSISLNSHGWLSLNDQAVAVRGRKWNRRRKTKTYPPWRAPGASTLPDPWAPPGWHLNKSPELRGYCISWTPVNLCLGPHSLMLSSASWKTDSMGSRNAPRFGLRI